MRNKNMLGGWVISIVAKRKRAKEERGSDTAEEEEERVKPPLHTVKKEADIDTS